MRKVSGLVLLMSLFTGVIWAQSAEDIAAMLGYPQTIVYNAKIVTVSDGGFTSNLGAIGQAMAVRDEKVLAVGSNNEIRALAGPETRLVDLKVERSCPASSWCTTIPWTGDQLFRRL